MRGQIELIGLVFIVVIMVMGLLFFVSFSNPSDVTPRNIEEADNYGKSLEAAMLETTIPSCGYDLATALDRCVRQQGLKCGQSNTPVCDAAEDAWREMLELSLQRPYMAYVEINDDILNTGAFEDDSGTCEGPNRLAAPSQILQTNAGQIRFTIEFC